MSYRVVCTCGYCPERTYDKSTAGVVAHLHESMNLRRTYAHNASVVPAS